MEKVQIGYVYGLIDEVGTIYYVGSTFNLYVRTIGHRYMAKNSNEPLYCYIRENSIAIRVKTLRRFPCKEEAELLSKERYYIQKLTKQGVLLLNRQYNRPKKKEKERSNSVRLNDSEVLGVAKVIVIRKQYKSLIEYVTQAVNEKNQREK